MGYAFISYSSQNRELASKIKSILNNNGIETWLAPDNISPGCEYDDCIVDAIKSCSCVILLLSQAALKSTWIPDEISLAHDNQKRIIPIKLEHIESLGKLEIYIRRYQCLNLETVDKESAEIKALIQAAKAATSTSENEVVTSNTTVVTPVEQDKKTAADNVTKLDKRRLITIIVSACVIFLAIAIALTTAFSSFLKQGKNDDTNENQNLASSVISSTQEQTNLISSTPQASDLKPIFESSTVESQDQSTSEVTASTPVGENQLSSKYDEDIEALKYMDSMSLMLRTLRINVGGGITPQSAQVWGNVTIYSQNTAVAIGDGLVVKGVAKGETYIVVQSNTTGMSQAYYVVVE